MITRWPTWIILGLTLTFLIGPFIIIIFAGMSAGNSLAFPPQGLSLKWYLKVFTIESFHASFALSMFLAVFGTLAALIIGIPAAYALNRYDIPGAETIKLAVAAPIIVPGIIVGLALLRYLVVPLDVTITMALFVAHTALVLPYAVRVVSSSLQNLRVDMEEAAILLGCSRLQAFMKVVLPNIRGGVSWRPSFWASSQVSTRCRFRCSCPVLGSAPCRSTCCPTWRSPMIHRWQPCRRCSPFSALRLSSPPSDF
jgi:putative spermidine/putrescine transport system permease protein